MLYKIGFLPAGRYCVYQWNPGIATATEISSVGNNKWIKVNEIVQPKSAPYKRMFNIMLVEPYPKDVEKLKKAYPDHIKEYNNSYIILNDNSMSLFDDGEQKITKNY